MNNESKLCPIRVTPYAQEPQCWGEKCRLYHFCSKTDIADALGQIVGLMTPPPLIVTASTVPEADLDMPALEPEQ